MSSLIPDGTKSVATRATTKSRRRRQAGRRRATPPRGRAWERVRGPAQEQTPSTRFVWALTRVVLGFVFIWAFLRDITGFASPAPPARSFLIGGGPVRDYMLSAHGALAGFFHALAGPTYTQTIFRATLALIGATLILGLGMRLAAIVGTILL
ncbi:MAG TPA: hypothetical protein VIR33_07190, partial [Thermopolyspora sp.]